MNQPWQLRVYDGHELVYTSELTGPAELGRQSDTEEELYSSKQAAKWTRVVIAGLRENDVSRSHALVEPLADGRVRILNRSSIQPVCLRDGSELKPGDSCETEMPALLSLGRKLVRVQEAPSANELESLAEVAVPPGSASAGSTRLPSLWLAIGSGMPIEAIVRWLQVAMDVLHSCTNCPDFFEKAARAVVDLVNLDSGSVLLWHEGDWKMEAVQTAPHIDADRSPSRHVLRRVREEKKTFWQVPLTQAESLAAVEAVVAAPILNPQGEVIGALYGDRRRESRSSFPITKLEGMLVELLASGVAAGLARMEQEKAALAARVQLEQFFTPELARQLSTHPDLLKGRDCEVSILFCDIRGFSRISERLGTAKTVEWISEVLSALSDCVLTRQGVLVDYIGDELMAMWGAPEQQADHARLACRAALDMLSKLPALNQRWEPLLGESMEIGIGVNCGTARVGNTGSQYKFKYGPLGNTVNLASRVQGATKYLRSNLLITDQVRKQLGPEFDWRRVCKVRVINIEEPVSLYELAAPGHPGWDVLKKTYEAALAHFEAQEFRQSARALASLVAEQVNDGPALILFSRAVHSLVEGPAEDHPVWVLPGK
jgi:adenylate cyclase